MSNLLSMGANGAGNGTNNNAMSSPWLLIGYIVVLVAIFYFLMIRPQKKRQKKEEAMRNNVQVGDEIITIAGVYGRVVAVKEDSFIIESGPDRSKQRIARWAIQQNLTVHEDEQAK